MAATVMSHVAEVTLFDWETCRRQLSWDLPDADRWTFHRGSSPVAAIENMEARTIVVPVGQGSPETSHPGDVTVVGLVGELDFSIRGDDYLVGPRDILRIPAGEAFSYRNVALEPAVMFVAAAVSTEPDPAQDSIHHFQWTEYRRRFTWDLPWASTWGYHLGSGPHVLTKQLRGHMIHMPPGQSRPWHAPPRDIVILMVQGDIQFHCAGDVWPMAANDILAIPKETPYIYRNVGLEPALLLSIGGPTPAGHKTAYWAEDPGWPVRPDAKRLETVTGHEGEQRLVSPAGG